MTSLCRHLSPCNLNSSTAQEIVNWVTTADGCVHTAEATQLDNWVASAVCIGLQVKVTVKVKNKLKKRHKTTRSVYRYRGAGYVTVNHCFRKQQWTMCLESTTENRQTVCFNNWGWKIVAELKARLPYAVRVRGTWSRGRVLLMSAMSSMNQSVDWRSADEGIQVAN